MITLAEVEYFEDGAGVRDVITRFLLAALPPDYRAAAPDLVDRVVAHPDVEPHIGKPWSDLTESECNLIAREVRLVARDVAAGAGSTGLSGEHLH